MTTKRFLLLAFACFGATVALFAQRQLDFREQSNLRVEHRFTQDFSMAVMGAAILTNDFQRVGFVYGDVGLGYRLAPNFSINANYRILSRRSLNGAYDKRHVLYFDLDFSKGLQGPWTLTGTLRMQGQYFNHLFSESYRDPSFLARTRVGLRYKINYYWQPFTESEIFTPLSARGPMLPNQWRYSIGFAYTFNRYVRVEFYEQLQKSLFSAPGSTFLLTAMNWGFRF